MKGISPVVTLILLLVITIAVTGLSASYFSQIIERLGSGSTEQLDTSLQQSREKFRIEGFSETKVYIRNIGQDDIDTSKISFYVDNVFIPQVLLPFVIPENVVATVELSQDALNSLAINPETRLNARGAFFSDSIRFPYVSVAPIKKCAKYEICTGIVYFNATNLVKEAQLIAATEEISKFDVAIINVNAYKSPNDVNKPGEIADLINTDVALLYYDPFTIRSNSSDISCCPPIDWDTADAHEDWFLHNSTGGRWNNPTYPINFWMNTSNPVYRTYIAELLKNTSDFDPAFDGIFADETGDYTVWILYGLGIPPNLGPPPYNQNEYEQSIILALQEIKQKLGNKLLVPNGAVSTFTPYENGNMLEEFAIRPSNSITFRTEQQWKTQINILLDSSYDNKISFAMSKFENGTDLTVIPQLFNFSFASYLLGKNPNAYAVFGFSDAFFNTVKYYPEYAINIGNPLGRLL